MSPCHSTLTFAKALNYTMPKQKIFLVTGASGAIASQICTTLESENAIVLRLDRHAKANTDLVTDVGDPNACHAAIAKVLEQHGRLDGIIHTIGGFAMQGIGAYTPDLLPQMLEANLFSAVNMAMAALPALEPSGGFFGAIAAAQVARGGGAKVAAYTASKGAMALYLKSLALEVKTVRFGIVYPMGTVDTPANRREMPNADFGSWIAASEIADAFVYLASRNSGRVQEIQVFGNA
jgi:NAD(P)-dependent dehydrogenase (short-subunit alcohol dehydrogenase family)